MTVSGGLPAMTPFQRETYRRFVLGIATSDSPAGAEVGADRIAGRIALGGWYGLRADERAAPLSPLGRRLLRFRLRLTTATNKVS